MASYFAQYFYVVGYENGILVVVSSPTVDLGYQTLQNSGGPGAGSFSPGDTIVFNGGNTETYTGYTEFGPVTKFGSGSLTSDGGYLYSNNQSLLAGETIPYLVDSFPVCFLAGTQIKAPAGDVRVEALAIGDLVLTADGRVAPVRWVGIQSVVSLFADRLRSFPIRITTGALGDGLPVRDLFVSPDHALFLDGALVQAGALVNGTTIVRETEMPERFTYFHVELEDHSLILAEGVPAETFLDTVTRRRFDNWAEYEARYGDTGPLLAELPAPRIKSARQLPRALRDRLAMAAGSEVAKDVA